MINTELESFFIANPAAKSFMEAIIKESHAHEPIYMEYISVEAALDVLFQDCDIRMSRSEVVQMLQHFEKCGFGRFIIGRRNKSSRFQWMHNLKALRNDLLEKVSVLGPKKLTPSKVLREKDEKIDLHHQFHLRSDYTVKFDLPANLSSNEALRLAKFIESLPMAA